MNIENTEGAIQNGQSRETCTTGYTKLKKTKKQNTQNTVLDITTRKQTQKT